MSKNKVPQGPLMYIGPTTRQPMPTARGAVFPNGLPKLLREKTAQDAAFAALFVPLSGAGAALRKQNAATGRKTGGA